MKNFAAVAVSALLGATIYAGTADAAAIKIKPPSDPLFSADGATITHNAKVQFAHDGSFTEQGIFRIDSFNNGGSQVSGTGLGTHYNILGQFAATGDASGRLTSLSFSLILDTGHNTTLPLTGTIFTGNTADDIVLGTGSRLGGLASVTPDPLHPGNPFGNPFGLSLAAVAAFEAALGEEGFFNLLKQFQIQIAATATDLASDSTCKTELKDCQITIHGGGGDISFELTPVPEPATLGLLGVGLIGVGALRRRARA